MNSPRYNIDIVKELTGYSGWSLYCAIISIFGLTGYYSDLFKEYLPLWIGVGILILPVIIVVFLQWGETSDRVVALSHIIAASWFMLLALGLELGCYFGCQPKGTEFYRIVAHLGWSFAWLGIYRRAKQNIKIRAEQDSQNQENSQTRL